MSKPTAISFSAIRIPDSGVVVVLAGEGLKLSPAAKALDAKSDGQISRAAKISRFTGRKGSALDLLVPAGLGLARLVVAGVGDTAKYEEKDWLALGGALRAKLTGRENADATILLEAPAGQDKITGENAAGVALGATLRGYKFLKYKTKKKNDKNGKNTPDIQLKKLTIGCGDLRGARRSFSRNKAVAEGVTLARDLVNEPANTLTPLEFARRTRPLGKLDVKVQVLDEKALQQIGMRALLAVGQGSTQPSRVVVMNWQGARKKDEQPVVFVGKGVTFDTGGISLKPAQGMEDMKGDMAGAACVAGLMQALAARKAKVNAVGIIGLVENMPSGVAQRPGDIVKSMSGQTIEVLNTDAEGRLVLADTLWYAQQKYKPKCLINLATLTGAVIVALGKEHAGLFSNNDALCDQLAAAGLATGDKVWRLPLGAKYDKLIDSKIADVKNTGGRWASSITAAQFLQRFVNDDVPWAHLDIAGTGMAAPKTDINQSWGSGFGVRLLDRLVADNYEG
ncbi:MAG: leucyl aminopeptidase [Methyloligellaceae bacterium]